MDWKWPSAEMTAALSAVVVGIAALIVAVDQSNIARKQADWMERTVQASVWPVVQFDFRSDQDIRTAEAILSLRNSGVGPAIIKGIRITKHGKEVSDVSNIYRAQYRCVSGHAL